MFNGGWALWGWMLGRARASHSGQMYNQLRLVV